MMPERIGDDAGTVAPKHVRRRIEFFHAPGNRALIGGIHVWDIKIDDE